MPTDGAGGLGGPGDWSLPPVEPASPLGFEARLPSGGAHRPPAPLPSSTTRTPTLDEGAPPPPPEVPRRNPSSEPVSPLRALAGALVAVAGVLLGIGALLWATNSPDGDPTLQASQGQTFQASPSASALPSAVSSPAVSPTAVTPSGASSAAATRPAAAPVPKLPLTVLNNSTRSGLADRAAARFRAGGWPVKLTGNFRGRITDTTVYYAPGQLASAQLLQRSFPGLTRVRPRFAGLPGSGLTVVLTRAYTA